MTTNVHYGSYETIPDSASEGLLFLKSFLSVLDSLDASPPIDPYVFNTTQFVLNRDAPITVEKLSEMHQMRHRMLQVFRHDVTRAWEIERDAGITVIFESESTTQFKGYDVQVKVAEMNTWELKRVSWGRLRLTEARCWMDPSAVQKRANEFFGNK
jgi:hypothetical protein